jgi:hypothetical protein
MLCEFPDKSKGCLMSIETRTVGAVTQTSETELAADQQHSFANVLLRFKAAPTVADTSVSRQTGLSGIWNQSSDPASQTSILHSGMTNQMKNNTLVVRPKNRFLLPSSRCPWPCPLKYLLNDNLAKVCL